MSTTTSPQVITATKHGDRDDNVLDLIPQGRGSCYASLDYGTRVNWSPRH